MNPADVPLDSLPVNWYLKKELFPAFCNHSYDLTITEVLLNRR